jgi:hypothetical protein
MADAVTLYGIYVVLNDSIPGYFSPDQSLPLDGFAGADHHNVASAKYPLGTKKAVYISSLKSYSVLTYLQAGTTAGAAAIAAGRVCVPEDVTNNASYLPSKVCGDPDEGLLGSAACIAISAMTDSYYGWFWTGGCCPVGHGSMTATTVVASDDSVAVGCTLMTCDLTADYPGIKIGAAAGHVIGYALKAD